MDKLNIFQKTSHKIALLGLIILIIAFSLFNSGLRLNDRIGFGLFVLVVLIAVSGSVHGLVNKSPDKKENWRTAKRLHSFFKISAIIGSLTSVLVYVGATITDAFGDGTVSGPYLGVLLAVWVYAGLILAALSLLAMVVTSMAKKNKGTDQGL